MMASKRKRGESWEYIVKRKGVLPKPIYLTFKLEAEGDAYVAKLERLLDAGIVPDDFKGVAKASTTLGQVMAQYMDAVHIAVDDLSLLQVLRGRIGSVGLERVNYQWAEEWISLMRVDGLAPSTIRHKVGALARCLDWVVRSSNTILVANPLRILPKRYATTADGRKDVERDRRLHDGEEERIWAILNGEKPEGRQRALPLQDAVALRLMFTLALETAMRMREIYTLTADQVDIPKRTIYLVKTKNGNARQVPISSVAIFALRECSVTSGSLFSWWDGDAKSLQYMTDKLSHQWSRIFSAAGCKDLRFHDLRHEATSRLFERTKMNDIQISRITGHKSLQMLRRYANLRGSDLADHLW